MRTLVATQGRWLAGLAAPSAAAAAARRTRCRRSSQTAEPPQDSSHMTHLESRSVADATRKDYFKKMRSFLEWALEAGLDWSNVQDLDNALALYFDKLFYLGMAGD
eukprot:2649571-Pyramimonas_sp.AAC.1